MQADKVLFDALSQIGLPVNRIAAKFASKTEIPEQYFIYAITGGAPFYNDDYLEYIEVNYAVMLFSKIDYTNILRQTIEALNTERVKIQFLGPELYDPEIDFYQITINVSVNENWGG